MIIEKIEKHYGDASEPSKMSDGRLRDIQAGTNTFTYAYSRAIRVRSTPLTTI